MRQIELDRLNRPRRPQLIEIPRSAAWIALAASVLLAGFSAQSFLENGGEASRSEIVEVTPPLEPESVFTVANVVDSMEARWSGATQPIGLGERLPVGPLTLEEGGDGTRVVGEAPFMLDILSSSRLRLVRGKVIAKVPEEAIGFTVSTAAGAIVDLGTEFGVEVSTRGEVGVHVLDGAVALAAKRDKPIGPPITLTAGLARRIETSGEIVEIECDGASFLREVPASPYELAVLQSRPVCFWRFNDSAAVNSRGQVEMSWPVGSGITLGIDSDRPEAGNSAMLLSGEHDGISLKNIAELNRTSDFTIESWVRPNPQVDDLGGMRILSNFQRTPERTAGYAMGIGGKDFTDGSQSDYVFAFTFFGVYDVISTTSIDLDRWTHLAVVVAEDGRPLMYVNGEEVELLVRALGLNSPSFEPMPNVWSPNLRGNPSSNSCCIGRHPPSDNRGIPPERWHGGIDELVVFDRTLTADDIAKHYKAGLKQSAQVNN